MSIMTCHEIILYDDSEPILKFTCLDDGIKFLKQQSRNRYHFLARHSNKTNDELRNISYDLRLDAHYYINGSSHSTSLTYDINRGVIDIPSHQKTVISSNEDNNNILVCLQSLPDKNIACGQQGHFNPLPQTNKNIASGQQGHFNAYPNHPNQTSAVHEFTQMNQANQAKQVNQVNQSSNQPHQVNLNKVNKQNNTSVNLKEELYKLTKTLDKINDKSNLDKVSKYYDDIEEELDLDNELENLEKECDELLEIREVIAENIEKEEKIINKANQNLNEEIFEQRCRDQDERKKKQQRDEKLSIFASQKTTYLRIKAKVNKEVLKEANIPCLFKDAYPIFKFMHEKDLISFTSNVDVESEYAIYEQLYKVIESYEYNNRSHDSDSDSEDPINDIEEEFSDLCTEFIEIIEKSNIEPISQDTINDMLNENSKDKILKIFNTDSIDKENFVKDDVNTNDDSF